MIQLMLEGKAASGCETFTVRKDGRDVTMYQVKVLSQDGDDTRKDCLLALVSYDPDITDLMKSTRSGDHIMAIGKLQVKYRNKDGEKVPFYYSPVTTYKHWHRKEDKKGQ